LVGFNKLNDRIYSRSEVLNNKIYIIAGNYMNSKCGYFSPVNDVISSTNGVDWITVTGNAKFLPRYGHSTCVFNNLTYLFGGYAIDTGFKRFQQDIWDNPNRVGDKWYNPIISTIGNRAFASMVTFNAGTGNKLWIMGGMNNTGAYSDIWNSADGIHWKQILKNAPWSGRYQHVCLNYGGKLWIIGGKSWYESPLNDVWNSSDGINWARISNSAPVGIFSGNIYQNRMWLIGGENYGINSFSSKKIWQSVDGINWIPGPDLGINNVPHTSVVLGNHLYIIVTSKYYGGPTYYSLP
jgi:hypothetical protein